MDKRPVNLDLMTIKFPPMAIASILHRISGVILFLTIPLLLCLLDASLSSPEQFVKVKSYFTGVGVKLILLLVLAAMLYHLLAGIRHMLMDIGFFEGLRNGRRGALLVISLSIILIILAGIWLW